MSGKNEKIKNRGFRKKISPQIFFPFPHKILQKNFPTYIFISHTKVSFLTQSFTHKTLSFSLYLSCDLSHSRSHTHTHTTSPALTSRAEPSPVMTQTRPSPAIDSSPPRSLYRQPIPIGSLSLTTRSFLPFSLSPFTTPMPIHFSSPYPYPYPFRFCLVSYLFDFLF